MNKSTNKNNKKDKKDKKNKKDEKDAREQEEDEGSPDDKKRPVTEEHPAAHGDRQTCTHPVKARR